MILMQNQTLLGIALTTYLLLNQTHSSSKYTRATAPTQSVSFEVLGPGGQTVILPTKTVPIHANSTVLSVSSDALKASHLPFQTGGSDTDIYITSIAGLSQQDNGPLSGWIYKVNNTFPSEAPSVYKVKPGDLITWVYTNDLGKDVGAPSAIVENRAHKLSINNIQF